MKTIELSDPRVKVQLKEGVGTVLFDDPKNFNALDAGSCGAFAQAVGWLDSQPELRVVLLRASGKAFSVGGSIAMFSDAGDQVDELLREMTKQFHDAVACLMRMDAPVIAVVNGVCGGGGASLTCIADMTIAAESAKITFAYTLSAISPDGGSTFALPRIVGIRKAYELMVMNPTLSAEEAKELGIVTRVVPDQDLDSEAEKLAQYLAAGPTRAFGAVKQLLLKTLDQSPEVQMGDEGESIATLAVGKDGQEGIQAFLQKRKPHYEGR
ncbi:MAG: enoyl-CoA hydratase-related protein [Porticoccaceae bacterium]|nr:enoyl-CoA hydratase/isomerase family protein [Pseudomonadales bacterium]MCP5172113.1 enoyl-CoA hydratase/isomerase family protein [Pseudomonadales bacterium]